MRLSPVEAEFYTEALDMVERYFPAIAVPLGRWSTASARRRRCTRSRRRSSVGGTAWARRCPQPPQSRLTLEATTPQPPMRPHRARRLQVGQGREARDRRAARPAPAAKFRTDPAGSRMHRNLAGHQVQCHGVSHLVAALFERRTSGNGGGWRHTHHVCGQARSPATTTPGGRVGESPPKI